MGKAVAGPEKDFVEKLVGWLGEAGWSKASEERVDRASMRRHDAIIDTGHGLVVIDAKRRETKDLGRVSVEAYPSGYRIYLAQQSSGDWRIRTESNTYDPRPLNAETVKQVLLEMLGAA